MYRHLHGDTTLEQVNFKELYRTNQLIKSNQTPSSLLTERDFLTSVFDYCLFTKIII